MTNWKCRINLAAVLQSYDDNEDNIPSAGRQTAALIRMSDAYQQTLFKSYLETLAERFEQAKTEASFNKVLNVLYNYADINLIWIEGMRIDGEVCTQCKGTSYIPATFGLVDDRTHRCELCKGTGVIKTATLEKTK